MTKRELAFTKYNFPAEYGWLGHGSFTLTINNLKETGQLIGRGSDDDKDPILGRLDLSPVQYHHRHNIPLLVNIVCCFEGDESGSEGLDDLVRLEFLKGIYFHGVEIVCIVSQFSFLQFKFR